MKIRRVEAELFHADGRTDGQTDRGTDKWMNRQQSGRHDEANAFCNFANAPTTNVTIRSFGLPV